MGNAYANGFAGTGTDSHTNANSFTRTGTDSHTNANSFTRTGTDSYACVNSFTHPHTTVIAITITYSHHNTNATSGTCTYSHKYTTTHITTFPNATANYCTAATPTTTGKYTCGIAISNCPATCRSITTTCSSFPRAVYQRLSRR